MLKGLPSAFFSALNSHQILTSKDCKNLASLEILNKITLLSTHKNQTLEVVKPVCEACVKSTANQWTVTLRGLEHSLCFFSAKKNLYIILVPIYLLKYQFKTNYFHTWSPIEVLLFSHNCLCTQCMLCSCLSSCKILGFSVLLNSAECTKCVG